MPKSQKPSSASRVFSHLTGEERLDKACELLAMGIMRLAKKRELLKARGNQDSKIETIGNERQAA